MPKKNVTVYKALISCPSDVKAFVPGVENAIYRFNRIHGLPNDIMLLPVYYENSAYSAFGDHPQSILNKQIVDDADFAISIFWTRFGSPTQHHDSGTEEEILYMLERNKQVFLYFLKKPFVPDIHSFEQFKKLMDFKASVECKSLPAEVKDEEELFNKIFDQLVIYFNQQSTGSQLLKAKKKNRILWVDDRPENNAYVRRVFEQFGIEVLIALSTDQAMGMLAANDVSLIISDMGRKEGLREGYVLLEKVRKINHSIAYYIYAGSGAQHHVDEALSRGAQGCTNDPEALIDLVFRALLAQ